VARLFDQLGRGGPRGRTSADAAREVAERFERGFAAFSPQRTPSIAGPEAHLGAWTLRADLGHQTLSAHGRPRVRCDDPEIALPLLRAFADRDERAQVVEDAVARAVPADRVGRVATNMAAASTAPPLVIGVFVERSQPALVLVADDEDARFAALASGLTPARLREVLDGVDGRMAS
jgi:hypothetical protein